MTDPHDSTDEELIAHALDMWANWIETGNTSLSALDAEQQKLKVKALDVHQMKLIIRLRDLKKEILQ